LDCCKKNNKQGLANQATIERELKKEVPQAQHPTTTIQHDPELGTVVETSTQAALQQMVATMKREQDETMSENNREMSKNMAAMVTAIREEQEKTRTELVQAKRAAPLSVSQLTKHFGDEDGEDVDGGMAMPPPRSVSQAPRQMAYASPSHSVPPRTPALNSLPPRSPWSSGSSGSPTRAFKAMITVPNGVQAGDLLNVAPPPALAELLHGSPENKKLFDVAVPAGSKPGDGLLMDVTWQKDMPIAVAVSPASQRPSQMFVEQAANHERGQVVLDADGRGVPGPPSAFLYNNSGSPQQVASTPLSMHELESAVKHHVV
jgi:hypothetical protein